MEVEPFTEGSIVEVSSDEDGFYGAWYVATVVDLAAATPTKRRASDQKKKKRNGYLVKYVTLYEENSLTEPLKEVVDPSYVRPLPPRNPRRNRNNDNQEGAEVESEEVGGDFQVYDVVDAYLRDGWWIGVVSKVIIIDGKIKKYLISFESPPEEIEFEGSQMRLHVDWVNSRWQLPPPKETCETQDGSNIQLKRKRGRQPKSRFQSPNGSSLSEGKKDSCGILEIITELDEQPRCQGLNPSPIVKKSSDHDEPITFTPAAMVNEGQSTEKQHGWPFIKQSPIWSTLDSTQNPHFSPLQKMKEDCREGLAIGLMVTFTNVVQRTTNLQWSDPNHVINNSLETLVELEEHGFDVGPLRARLYELLAKKDEAGRLECEMKEAEKEMDKCNMEKTSIDEEINVLEMKKREVEEKMVKAVAMKNVKDEEVMVLRSKLQLVSRRIEDWKLGFEELVGSPL